MMRNKFRSWLGRQQYNPTLMGMFVNPFWVARYNLHQSMQSYTGAISGRLLDVGCGSKPYRDIFKVSEYVGLELDSPRARSTAIADYFYDGLNFPFNDNEFDSVLCNQVLEHVFNPKRFLSEVNRILKPGGQLLLTVPFVWDEHEQPLDFARYSSFGLKVMLNEMGFEIKRRDKLASDFSVIVQLINAYLFKVVHLKGRAYLLFCIIVTGPINLMGTLLARVLPKNPDLYLDQVVLARKL
jgi:SAM-dependent methyltransferase